jgi:hypothetical protein
MARIKPKYNATPTARERDYHLWLIDAFPCACGFGAVSSVVHHPLTRHPDQRWRRDHEFVVPMHGFCHMDLHGVGNETLFRPLICFASLAWQFRADGYDRGYL